MATFFTHDVHWLFTCLHWLRHDIFAPWTFGVFVFIGVAQAVIGWESGELAVRALPLENCTLSERRRYLRLVRVLASLLLPATIFIGVVNDRSQRDSDEKAKQAMESEQRTQAKLDESINRAQRSDDAFQAFAHTLDPSKLTVSQMARYVQAQRASAQISPVQASLVAPQPAIVPPVIYAQPSSAQLLPSSVPTRDSVMHDIEQTRSKLQTLSERTRQSVTMTLSSVRGMYVTQSGSQEMRDHAFRATLPRISEILDGRNVQFQQLLPEIERERSQAFHLLNLNAAETSSDKAIFEKALDSSKRKMDLPQNWGGTYNLYGMNYPEMDSYLTGLFQRLIPQRPTPIP